MSGGLELWGGVECTVSRVADQFIDQLELTGHARRERDIDLIASLGLRTVRYPVIWERTASAGVESADWSWPDRRLKALRDRGINPILGLLHHGSGPATTWLGDDGFPSALAEYARACAARYGWVEWVTPVNEPLTTARFSGLYGHWYPHARDDQTFVKALMGQCAAIRAAMRAIRELVPAAKLLQTEDLGHIHSTAALAAQAQFENERRWLSWDLLCGRVDRWHPLYAYLVDNGASRRLLGEMVDEPCPPDVIGIDYYVTSERFLDDDVYSYPPQVRGSNGQRAYADVEVVRARPELRKGLCALLEEAWNRYHITMVVSEVTLACGDEGEAVRWLNESWHAALAARHAGCDVRAVTAWALFGAMGWDTLSTSADGRYEAGVFDASSHAQEPRPTLLAAAVRDFASNGFHEHELLATPGWWQPEAQSRSASLSG